MLLSIFITFIGYAQTPSAKTKSQSQNIQSTWPKVITPGNVRVLVYQPQPDSLSGNKLYVRAAVSVGKNNEQPVFGAIWVMATISSDREAGKISLLNASILNVRFPNQDSIPNGKIDQFKKLLETEIPKSRISMTMDELVATL